MVAQRIRGRQRTVGAHAGVQLAARVGQDRAGLQQARLDQHAERDARLGALAGLGRHVLGCQRLDLGDALARDGGIVGIAFEADEAAAEAARHRAGRAGAEERIEDRVAGIGRGHDAAEQQRFGLLRRVRLLAVVALQALAAGAERQQPVGAHLGALVQLLHRIVVEGIALRRLVARRPDQRLVCVGEALAAEVRHRVRLAPHDVVQQPEALILQCRADAKDVVVAADHPERALGLQRAPRGRQPRAGELVVEREACPDGLGGVSELVPVVVDRVDLAVVGTQQVAAQLKIVGRVGEDHVDGSFRQGLHQFDAVADEHAINFIHRHRWKMSPQPCPVKNLIESIA